MTFAPPMELCEGRSLRNVLYELNLRIKAEGIEFGESDFSAFAFSEEYVPWPSGYRWLVCYPVRGSNEGWYVHIATIGQPEAKGTGNDYVNAHRIIALAKTWDAQSAWAIAQAVWHHLDIT
jgi:hypothetical protein